VAAACAAASSAGAHGFGERYDLPLPFTLYLYGAAGAIVLSLVALVLLVRRAPAHPARPRIDLLKYPIGRAAVMLCAPLRLATLILLALTIVAGFLGDQSPYKNIAPTLVWIIFWVGMTFASALIGNIWDALNPWRTLFAWADRVWHAAVRRGLALELDYPRALGVWPAFVLLLGFCWIELVDPDAGVPAHLAVLALAYTALTLAGMTAFGADRWLRHGEVFSVVFGLYARFAPTEIRLQEPKAWDLRRFGAGLIEGEPASFSTTALVLLVLSSVLFDGLSGTPQWSLVEDALRPHLPGFGESASVLIKTFGLVAFWLAFFSAYLAISAIMSTAVGGWPSTNGFAQGFAFTLVPIAIGYHVAHYLAYLLVQGQYIIPLLSDPLGRGWNLIGTAAIRPDITVVGARFEWYSAVVAVVSGHLLAVYLAHVQAIRLLGDRALVLRSQVLLTALMVIYTMVSLSILAEPIVTQRTAAQPSPHIAGVAVPPDALLPDADGRLQPVGAGRVAKTKLTFRLLGSAFHDGTRTSVADLVYSYAFAYRWGARADGRSSRDVDAGAATARLRRDLVAFKVVGVDTGSKSFRVGDVSFVRELFTVDVYANVLPQDPERENAIGPPWSTVPWHVLALMEEAVARGYAAFSRAEATRAGVEWLDLVRSDPLKEKLAALVASFERAGFRPDALRAQVSEEDARKRWAALAAFFKEHGHFLVTNGPYRLKRWSTHSVTLEAFRDLTYPLGVGSYDAYAVPRRGFISGVDWTDARATISGDIEVMEKFQRSYRLVRTPLVALPREVARRAAPECRYTVVDEQARIVLAGVTPLIDGATFEIDFRDRLPPGRYTMFAVIALAGNVMNADVKRIPVTISAGQ
jgi:hypothetical protein